MWRLCRRPLLSPGWQSRREASLQLHRLPWGKERKARLDTRQLDDSVALLELGANLACCLRLLCTTGFPWETVSRDKVIWRSLLSLGGAGRGWVLQQLCCHRARSQSSLPCSPTLTPFSCTSFSQTTTLLEDTVSQPLPSAEGMFRYRKE